MERPTLAAQILSFGNLQAAWRHIKKRGPAFGVDGQSVEAFEERSGIELRKLSSDLHSGAYVPQPLLGYSIAKDSDPSKRRDISIVAIRDRVAQQAFRQVIEPIWDRRFLETSHGWRRGRSVQGAIEAARDCIRGGNHWAVIADIEDCFGSLKPALILQQTSKWTNKDFAVVSWVDVWMRSGRILRGKQWNEHHSGIPQGMGIAPLLANRYLHELDVHAAASGWVYLRYGDDIRIFTRNKEQAQARREELAIYVEDKLQLTLKPRDEPLASVSTGIPYLGIELHGVSARLPEKKIEATIQKFRNLLPVALDASPEELDMRIQRWRSHYWKLLSTEDLKDVDRRWADWLAVRVREWRRGGASERALRRWLEERQWPFPLSPDGRTNRAKRMASGTWNIHNEEARRYAAEREVELGKQGITPQTTKPVSAKRRLAQQRRRFERRQLNERIAVISGPVMLAKSGNRLNVRRNGRDVARLNLNKCEHILLLSNSGSISIQAMDALCSAGVQLDRVDWRSETIGTISAPSGTHSARALSQLRFLATDRRAWLSARLISAKLRGQYNLLRYFLKPRPELREHERTIQRLERMKMLRTELESMTFPDHWESARSIILGHEGAGAAIYWSLMKDILQSHTTFEGRRGRGAKDPVNSALNYCYAIVASQVLRVIRKSGLLPELGVLHEGRPHRPALVYDLLEEYRAPAADRTVFQFVLRGTTLKANSRGALDDNTRKALARALMERLYLTVPWRGRRRSMLEILTAQVRVLIELFQGSQKSYRGFAGRY